MFRPFNKRGHAKAPTSGGSAAALIAIITFVIILYIAFLPSQEREDILDSTSDGRSTTRSDGLNQTLLLEHIGRVDFISKQSIDHLLPSLNLITRTEGSILEEEDSIFVRRAMFSERTDEVTFRIDDLDNVDNVLLNFVMEEGEGVLLITLNGVEIYTQKITEKNIEPIKLKKELLKNILHLSCL